MIIYYQSGFSSGAISKEFASNIDAPTYVKSCKRAMNMVLSPQGAATRRAGFAQFAGIQDEERRWTIPFKVNLETENYIIQFFESKIVISRVESSTEFQIDEQPYSQISLEKLSYAQIGTSIILASEGVVPRIIRRDNNGNFELRRFEFNPAPVMDENTGATKVFVKSGSLEVGTTNSRIGRTVSDPQYQFSSAQIGGTLAISEPSRESFLGYRQWEAGMTVAVNEYIVSQGTTLYRALDAGTSNIPPTHQFGTQKLGAIRWQYWNNGTGFLEITRHLGVAEIEGTILVALPPSVVGEDNATQYWNPPAFCPLEGYPVAVTFFQDRLVFAGSNVANTDRPFSGGRYEKLTDPEELEKLYDPNYAFSQPKPSEYRKTPELYGDLLNKNTTQRIWASVIGDYGNFDSSGELEERAIAKDLTSNEADKIVWLASTEQLVVGTQNGIFPFPTLSSPIGLDTITTGRNVSDSCGLTQPLLLNNLIIYTSETRNGLKSVIFNDTAQVFQSQNITLRNESLFQGIVRLQGVQEPANTVVCLTRDGQLVFFSFDITQGIACAYEWSIEGEEIKTLSTVGSKVFVTTKSGRSGVINLSAAPSDYKDFGDIISEAYIETLPVGTAQAGQVVGYFNNVVVNEIRVEVVNTQTFGINNGGSLINRKPGYGTDPLPKVDGYYSSSVNQSKKNEPIKIKSIEDGALTVITYGIVYSSDS